MEEPDLPIFIGFSGIFPLSMNGPTKSEKWFFLVILMNMPLTTGDLAVEMLHRTIVLHMGQMWFWKGVPVHS